MKKNIVLESFEFTDGDPIFTPRTPYETMLPEELKDIEKYPYMLDKACPFEARLRVAGLPMVLRGTAPKGFCYNMADIPFLIQILTFDKHSPFVKDASFIHDYLLDRKKVLYQYWELEKKGLTPSDMRYITSLIFCHQLKKNGVGYRKAHIMAFFVDLFQRFLPSWYNIDKVETVL